MSLRFVILFHDGVPQPHFDMMFETSPGSTLTTWQSPVWPLLQPAVLTRIDDHRRDYLEYEGPVSNNRGQVKRVSSGTCTITCFDNDSFWTIRFANRSFPNLHLKKGLDDKWLAMFDCH